MSDKKSISLSLVHIEDREIFVKNPKERIKENFDTDNLHIGINVNFGVDDKKELLHLHLALKYDYKDNEDTINLLKAGFTFIYKLKNLEEIIEVDEDVIDIPDDLAGMVLSIALSTSRGLIASKTRGYFINEYYLPILSVKDVLESVTEDKEDSSIT